MNVAILAAKTEKSVMKRSAAEIWGKTATISIAMHRIQKAGIDFQKP